MANSRDQAVQLINDAKLSGDANQKVDTLRGLTEIIIKKDPTLLQEFLPELVEFQVDPAALVRRHLAELLEDAATAVPRPPVLQSAAACLAALVSDSAPAVAKRAVAAAAAVFRSAFAIVAHQANPVESDVSIENPGQGPQVQPQVQALWDSASQLRAAVVALLQAGGAADSVRLGAAKFAEQAVLLFTASVKPPPPPGAASLAGPPGPLPADHALLWPSQLAKDAETAVLAVAALLKPPAVAKLSTPLCIVAVKVSGSVASKRPQYLGRLASVLIALAKATAQQVGGNVGTASTAKGLGEALAGIARNDAPAAQTWRPRLIAALKSLGEAGDSGSAAAAERLQRSSDAQQRRPPVDQQAPTKRVKLEKPATNGHAGTPPPTAVQPPPPPLAQAPPPPDRLKQTQFTLGALVARGDQSALNTYIASLPADLFADAVIANMAQLPSREAAGIDQNDQGAGGGLSGLLQGLQGSTRAQQAPTASAPASAAASATQPAPTAKGMAPGATAAVAQPPAAAKAAAAALKRPTVKAPPVARTPPMPKFELRPAELQADTRSAMRGAAVKRILSVGGAGLDPLRHAVLAHLVNQDAAAAEVVSHLLADFDRPSALSFVLAWLHALFALSHGSGGSGASSDDNAANGRASAAAAGSEPQPAAAASDAAASPAASSPHANAGAESGPHPAAKAAADAAAAAATSVIQSGSSRTPGEGQAPSAYQSVLLSILEGLREQRDAKDAAMMRLLQEAPLLPAPAVPDFLAATIRRGPAWATAGLSAAHNIALIRPPDREAALDVILQASVAQDADVHSKAVRLLANKLFPVSHLTAQIEAFATQQLERLLASAVEPPPVAAASDSPKSQDVAGTSESQQTSTAANEAAKAAPAVALADGNSAAQPAAEEVARAAQQCGLYCALCTKRHRLLRHLLEVFVEASPAGAAAIMKHARGLARTVGPQAPALLALVADPPAGSDALLLHMLNVLTDTAEPPPQLVAAALQRYDATQDVRWAVPVLAGVDSRRASQLLPPVTATCVPGDAATFDAALKRLLMPRPSIEGKPQMTPAQLLVGLHSIQPSPSGVPTKALMAALTACIAQRDAFPAEACAAALNQLVNRSPLPLLFMRFVMQARAAFPKLGPFVLDLLSTLIGKQVWRDNNQWKGWLMAAEQAGPAAFPALLSLPPSILSSGLATMRSAPLLRPKLAAYVASKECRVSVSVDTLRVLQGEAADV